MNHNKEYGGYLPIELNHGNDYFSYQGVHRYNCANAANEYILKRFDFDKVYVPYYLCPNVCAELEKYPCDIQYYHINYDLLPINDAFEDRKDCCIYLVDYFGIMDGKIKHIVESIKNATIIIDYCHSFFAPPVLSNRVFNIYSARKFFGVPDGAYLVSRDIDPQNEESQCFCSSEYSSYLLKSLEYGTNYAYDEKKKADLIISKSYGPMSYLAKRILENTDYEYVKKRRFENLKTYEAAFSNINSIHIEANSIPYVYPLRIKKNIKNELIENRIYVPTLWGHLLTKEFENTVEYDLSDNTLFLPLDQRYNNSDIKYIINVVKQYL